VLRSLFSVLEEVTLLVLPHGGQKTARRNAWKAAASLHVTTSYRWVDPVPITPSPPVPATGSAEAAVASIDQARDQVGDDAAVSGSAAAGGGPARLTRRGGRRTGPRALPRIAVVRS
jgi:hypothetical protein